MDFICFTFINYWGTGCIRSIRRLVKCQFGQCRRPIKYNGMSAMCDIYPRTNNKDRKILFVKLGPLVGTVTVSVFLVPLEC